MGVFHLVALLAAVALITTLVLLAMAWSEFHARRGQRLAAPDVWHTYASEHLPLRPDSFPQRATEKS